MRVMFTVPGSIDVAMADAPDLRICWSLLIYPLTLLLPRRAEDIFGELASLRDGTKVCLVKQIHDLIGDSECLILQDAAAWQLINKLP